MRRIEEQVAVITGASSGIGRATALQFGARGASVVLAARNVRALEDVAREVERLGGKAYAVSTDVARWDDVQSLASAAVERFGRIDTWVNVAAVSVYGTVEQHTVDEFRRVLDVNLLGPIYGAKAALPHLRAAGGGTIINVGSVESRRAVPLQAAYVAAKHGLKGFTDTLRMELDHERAGIAVVLVMPASMNTPIFEHARSKLGTLPQPIPPIYEPRVAAEAIVHAARKPQREIVAGGGGKKLTIAERISGSLVDRYMLQKGRAFKAQRSGRPDDERDNLDAPFDEAGSTTGSYGERAKSASIYTRQLGLHPGRELALTAGALLAAIGLGLLGWLRPRDVREEE